jgi:hypothetical protein
MITQPIPIKSPALVAVDAPAPSTKPPIPPQVTKKSKPKTVGGLGMALRLNP